MICPMGKMQIRELCQSDLSSVAELLRTRDDLNEGGAEKRKRLLAWTAFQNPYSRGEPTYFIAEEANKIIAHLGRMPVEFSINGNRQRGYFIHDLYVHPDYRKKGLGYFISMDLYNSAEQNSPSFCCLIWTSALNLKMQRRREYVELKADTFVKLINPYPLLKSRVKSEFLARLLSPVLKFFLGLIDSLVLLQPSRGKIFDVERFGSDFDILVQDIQPKLGICSIKRSDYLNWKYIDRPCNNRHVIGVNEGTKLKGVVILTTTFREGYAEGIILDMIADPDDHRILSSLCQAAIRYFREKKVDKIDCCFTNQKIIALLKRHLFLKATSAIPLVLANLNKTTEEDLLSDLNHWHLTYGESDKLMLSP